MKNNIYLYIFILILFSCCNGTTTEKIYMSTDSISYVKKFPIEYNLESPQDSGFDIIGIRSFCILDTVLAFTLKGYNNVVSFFTTSGEDLGEFINIGDGPNDFMETPNFNVNSKLYIKDKELKAFFFDSQKGRLLIMDVDRSIREKKLQMTETLSGLSNLIFTVNQIDDSIYIFKQLSENATQFDRYVIHNGVRQEIPFLTKLNMAKVPEGEDINILSTLTKVHNGIIVEAPIALNYLNVYSLDGRILKTICIDDEMYSISDICKKNRWERLYTFINIQTYDSFFGVLYAGEDEKTYQTHRVRNPLIFLFGWDGRPLAKIVMKRHITSFDIDFFHHELYTFDVHSDEFQKYDIKDLLIAIRKIK